MAELESKSELSLPPVEILSARKPLPPLKSSRTPKTETELDMDGFKSFGLAPPPVAQGDEAGDKSIPTTFKVSFFPKLTFLLSLGLRSLSDVLISYSCL